MTTRRTRKPATVTAPTTPALIAPVAALATATPTGRYAPCLAETKTPSIGALSFDQFDDLSAARAVAAWMQARYGAAYVVTVYDTVARVTV